MAEGLGLLAAAQSSATRIPYENIETNQKGLSGMMNAFQIAANVNRQRQALEQTIHNQNLKMMLDQADYGRKIDQMNMSAAMQMQRMNETQKMDAFRMQDMAIDNKRMQQAMEFSQGQKVQGANAVQSLSDDIEKMKAQPGTPEFLQEFPSVLTKNSTALAEPAGRQMARFFGGTHNLTASQQAAALNAQQSALDLEIKRNTGFPTNIIDSPWQAQKVWIPDPNHPGQQIQAKDPKTGEPLKTNNMFIPLPPTAAELQLPAEQRKPRWLTVDNSQLSDWHRRKNEIEQARKKIPGQIADPNLGLNAIPVPSNPVVDTPQVKQLTPDVARQFLQSAGGDKDKARQLATGAGYTF